MAKGKLSVVVSSRATNMLLTHVEFLSRVSIPAARKLHSEFKMALKKISETPAQYPFLDEENIPPQLYRKCLFYDRYQIVFLVIDCVAYIDVVHDCRQEPKKMLSDSYPPA